MQVQLGALKQLMSKGLAACFFDIGGAIIIAADR
jgi:hypothetical protein